METQRDSVINQVPDLVDYNLFESDPALVRAVQRQCSTDQVELARQRGARLGSSALIRLGDQANRNPPELAPYDRTGHRIDRVEFHPSWHEIMAQFRGHALISEPFDAPAPGAWASFGASLLMHAQIEAGSLCPLTMTFASIPVLARHSGLFEHLRTGLLHNGYDARDVPLTDKQSLAIGMGMTEKQGGSDVRGNLTQAVALAGGRRDSEYRLSGHKWFFSAPMCDAHLVTARTSAGISCFLVPRWRFDGSKNPVELLRLKDKLGNRSNSSAEVELRGASGWLVGEEGRGIATIIEMAGITRLHCCLSSAGLMRQALVQAIHHTRHRVVFGKRLIEQPLMTSVLADLALESEAAMLLAMELAAAFEQPDDPLALAWKRLLTPAAKFWICRRAVAATGEALEVWGGNGYVETGPMPRLYRETPVNSIWEGSGNVMCLDVLRAIERDPPAFELLLDDLQQRAAGEPTLSAALVTLRQEVGKPGAAREASARRIVQRLALAAQGCLMLQYSDHGAAFVCSRFDPEWGAVFGDLPPGIATANIVEHSFSAPTSADQPVSTIS